MYYNYPTKSDPQEKLLVKVDKIPVRHHHSLHPLPNCGVPIPCSLTHYGVGAADGVCVAESAAEPVCTD